MVTFSLLASHPRHRINDQQFRWGGLFGFGFSLEQHFLSTLSDGHVPINDSVYFIGSSSFPVPAATVVSFKRPRSK